MKRLSSFTPAQLQEAALAVIRDCGEVESAYMPHRVATQLGTSLTDAEALGVPSMTHHRQVLAAETRFSSRLRRALDQLAAQGLVIKIGAGQTLPSGYGVGNRARYYTPEKYATEVQKNSEDQVARIKLDRRWQQINQRLALGAGVTLHRQQLTVDQWEQLLDRGGW